MSGDDPKLPPEADDGSVIPLSGRDRAKAWRKAAYQRAKAAHQQRTAEAKTSPAAIAHRQAQADYRKKLYQRLKAQRQAAKEAEQPGAKAKLRPDLRREGEGDQAALEGAKGPQGSDLRLLLLTADKLEPKPRALRLVAPLEP